MVSGAPPGEDPGAVEISGMMNAIRTVFAFFAAAITTYLLAAIFYTQQILAKQAEIGANYTPEETFETYLANLTGLAPAYGLVLTIALLIAFIVAFGIKRVIRPLAPIAYPVAGAAAVFTAIYLIENVMAGGGAGAIGGARTTVGLALQCLAGAIGGIVFAVLRPHQN